MISEEEEEFLVLLDPARSIVHTNGFALRMMMKRMKDRWVRRVTLRFLHLALFVASP